MTMQTDERAHWWGWLRWPLALGMMAWLILPNLGGVTEIVAAGVIWPWLLAAAGLRLTAMGLASVRWQLLLIGQEIHLSGARIFRRICAGYVCNFLLPGTWGGDVARAGLIATDSPDRRMRAAATVPLDRGMGLLAFVLIGAISGLAHWSRIPPGLLRIAVISLVVLATSGIGLLCALLVLPMPRRLQSNAEETVCQGNENETSRTRARFSSVADSTTGPPPETLTRRQRLGRELLFGLDLLRASRSSVMVAFLLAVAGHMCLCLSLYCCLPAYPAAMVPVSATAHFWLVPAAEVPAAFFPVPGGVGAREGTLALLYGALTTDTDLSRRYAEIGVIVAATFSTVCLLLAVVIGLGLALARPRSDPQASGESTNGTETVTTATK